MGMFRPSWFTHLLTNPVPETAAERTSGSLESTFSSDPVVVAFATQTGAAEGIAEATLEQLEMAGINAALVDFYDLDLALLERASQFLFVTSTTYDGDPPDMAETFSDEAMRLPAALAHLHYAVLALGDRDYDEFCGFGHRLDDWLRASGAHAWFERIEVDDEDEQALARWHDHVAALARCSDHASPESATVR
jgi:sulfite reductase (NADPH) flavoprotein alpha-component